MAKRELTLIQAFEYSQPLGKGIHKLFRKAGDDLEKKDRIPLYTIYSQDNEHNVEYLTVIFE